MARRKRIILSGFPYHVMLRGNDDQPIFLEDSDRARLCLFIQYAIEKHRINVHGFCFMGNHIHLLVEPLTSELSAGIQSFASRYAQYYNRKYNRRGHLFQGRYKGVIVQHGVYFRRPCSIHPPKSRKSGNSPAS